MPEKSGIEARLCVRPSAWGRGAASCPKASGAAAAAHIPMKKCRSAFMFPSLLMICLCSWAIGNLERIAAGLKHLERNPVMLSHFSESWPGLSRPSTSCLLSLTAKDVDARDKRGHDAGASVLWSLQPPSPLEPQNWQDRAEHNQRQAELIAPGPIELRHILEIHSIDARHQGRRHADDPNNRQDS